MLSPLYGQLSPLRIPTKVRGLTDAAAIAYIAAVETVDGQALEDAVKFAYEDFILGCKTDGIWSAIKSSCILAGARTLSGALVPIVGTSPTNLNFVTGDYNRKTGLLGNGTNKYLNTNVAGNSALVPQDNVHICSYITNATTSNVSGFIGNAGAGATGLVINTNSSSSMTYNANGTSRQNINPQTVVAGFYGAARSNSSSFYYRGYNGITGSFNIASTTRVSGNIAVFGRTTANSPSNKRHSFYSLGEHLDLALLDTRVSNLMTALAAAIP